ncbi:MAG: hypothetical protein COY81_05455 [Candidatus Pacebacteria bacterium CG_4_10_14_0_8_um_filter_43_12]|nr:MAG: hypothetical protein COU66_04020 [Candidatus Pacebacteria bacterium CG10_big_fil_rev_8_21_14_0_10_44_11]PIY78924.1 MAG: hypothetical protein COY81_05455 [Candidatus Pacebacteria bacterium CG_4_10_14_0_8_um_filter_43_12]
MKKTLPNNLIHGFTLVELLLVLGLFTIIFALSNISLTGLIAKTSTQEFTQTVISDLRRQQNRAMTGDAAGGMAQAYGVRFETISYILFAGDTYNPLASDNILVQLPVDLQFQTINLPQQQVIFSQQSGEVFSYASETDTLILRNTTNNESVTIKFNSLGVITLTP